jgi:hypothetical protein
MNGLCIIFRMSLRRILLGAALAILLAIAGGACVAMESMLQQEEHCLRCESCARPAGKILSHDSAGLIRSVTQNRIPPNFPVEPAFSIIRSRFGSIPLTRFQILRI